MTDSKLNHAKNEVESLTAEYLIGPFKSKFTFMQMLYTHQMVITNQKLVVDLWKIKRNESKYFTKESMNHERREQRKEQRKTAKQP